MGAFCGRRMRTILYGKKAANLYTQAFVQNTQARALYQESEDTYYRANDAASYDDWRRARHQWDYFYNRCDSARPFAAVVPRLLLHLNRTLPCQGGAAPRFLCAPLLRPNACVRLALTQLPPSRRH